MSQQAHTVHPDLLDQPARLGGLVEKEALPAYTAALALVAFICVMVLTTDFRFDAPVLLPPISALFVMVGCGIHLRCNTPMTCLGSAVQGLALFLAISTAAPLCAVILASSALPLADTMLAQLDRVLFFGFERIHVVEVVVASHTTFELTKLVYHSLIWQPALLLAVLFARDASRAWALLFAWSVTLSLILAIFPLVPAAGAPPYFLDFIDTFNGARDGSLRVLGREALTGIITFPSFHAAAGILLGWGFASTPKLRYPFAALNVLMIASALIAGHYLIDLVAGGVIACLSILLARRVEERCR
jgi:hypothetical protein